MCSRREANATSRESRPIVCRDGVVAAYFGVAHISCACAHLNELVIKHVFDVLQHFLPTRTE